MESPESGSTPEKDGSSTKAYEQGMDLKQQLLSDVGNQPFQNDDLHHNDISQAKDNVLKPKSKPCDASNSNVPFPDILSIVPSSVSTSKHAPVFDGKVDFTSDEQLCTKHSGNGTGISESDDIPVLHSIPHSNEVSDMRLFVHSGSAEEVRCSDLLADVTLEDIEYNAEEIDQHISEIEDVNINCLPRELLQKIFTFLSQYDLCRSAACTCRLWRDLAYDPIHWQTLDFRDKNVAPGTLIRCINRSTRLKHLSWHDDLTLDKVIITACIWVPNVYLRVDK